MVPKKSGKQRTENKITQRDKKIQHIVHIIQGSIAMNVEEGEGEGNRSTARRQRGYRAPLRKENGRLELKSRFQSIERPPHSHLFQSQELIKTNWSEFIPGRLSDLPSWQTIQLKGYMGFLEADSNPEVYKSSWLRENKQRQLGNLNNLYPIYG